jgi:hypothetical protein
LSFHLFDKFINYHLQLLFDYIRWQKFIIDVNHGEVQTFTQSVGSVNQGIFVFAISLSQLASDPISVYRMFEFAFWRPYQTTDGFGIIDQQVGHLYGVRQKGFPLVIQCGYDSIATEMFPFGKCVFPFFHSFWFVFFDSIIGR